MVTLHRKIFWLLESCSSDNGYTDKYGGYVAYPAIDKNNVHGVVSIAINIDTITQGVLQIGAKVVIVAKIWHQRLQDKSCDKILLPKVRYKSFRTMALWTIDIPMHYYYLT